jgi:hypothetical protein
MQKIQSLFFLTLSFLITAVNSYSQEDSLLDNKNLQVETRSVTENCDIYLSGSYRVTEVSLGKLIDTTVNIYKEGYSRSFNVSEIKRITFKNHGFWAGTAYGFAGTVLALGLYGLVASHGGGDTEYGPMVGFVFGAMLGIPVGLVTGIITEFVIQDDVYNFKGYNPTAKIKRLKYIMNKHRK